ncbi:MAG: transglycosylase domain-containing protein [Candidatus Woesebacteria bacterium]
MAKKKKRQQKKTAILVEEKPAAIVPILPPVVMEPPVQLPIELPAPKRSLWPKIKGISAKKKGIIIGFFIFVLLAIIAPVAFFFKDLPSPDKLSSNQFPVSSKVLDRNGVLLYEFYGDKNRTPVKLADLPKYVYQASIAIEDQRFYSHFGFDVEGIIRAVRNIIFKQQIQGGSTITQQLVKTTLLNREKTLTRKAKEAVLTILTEIRYSKDEILEMYMNHIPYGGTTWGVEAAAHVFFDKNAKDLTIGQAAYLAGLPQAPSAYSPFGSQPERGMARQKEVLRRMLEEKYITQEQFDTAAKEDLQFATKKIDIKAPHFVFYIRDLLEEKYPDLDLAHGGYRIYTTLDENLQEKVQATVSAEIDKLARSKVGNGAALVIKPKSGEILAMVGSRDYYDATHDGQVNVTTRERQPGSSIKPLNYVTAFQLQKETPATMLLDIPTCFQVDGQDNYCPKNYDGTFKGPTQARFLLGNSNNIGAVKTLALNGLENFIATASAMGIRTWKDPSKYGLSLTLGGGEITMLDLATAYGTLANQGVRVNLNPIIRIQDYTGKIIEENHPDDIAKTVDELTSENATPSGTFDIEEPVERVLNRAPAYLISHILLDNNARVGAFGPSSQLVVPNQIVSVKTGTTNDLRDNWTVGYTPEYLTAVWVGNNDNSAMNRSLVSGVTGAAPIWNGIMRQVLKGSKAVWPDKPNDIVSGNVCITSGLLPDPAAPCPTRSEFFWSGTIPTALDPQPRDTWIIPTLGIPPKEGDPVDGLTLEKHLLMSDPFSKDYCVDCHRPVDDKGNTVFETTTIPFGFHRISE